MYWDYAATESQSPIFITGSGRSGKTLLGMILHSHEKIAIPRQEIALRRDGAGHGQSPSSCFAGILSSFSAAGYTFPSQGRINLKHPADLSAGEILGIVMDGFAAHEGKHRWALHSQKWEDEIDSLLETFPYARIIHMIRDPRDRCAALKQKLNFRLTSVRIGLIASDWKHSADLALKNQAEHPEHYRIVRYEELTENPESALRDILLFIGELPCSGLLDGLRHIRTKDGRCAYGSLTKDYIGIYKQTLNPSDILLLEYVAGRTMMSFGYHRSALGERASCKSPGFLLKRGVVSGRIALRDLYCGKHVMRRRIPLNHHWPSSKVCRQVL